MIWTRIGEGSKIIFTGDPMQSDLKNKSVDYFTTIHQSMPIIDYFCLNLS